MTTKPPENLFVGLQRGPIDHEGHSVINYIANGAIEMGSSVELVTPVSLDDLLAKVKEQTGSEGSDRVYGIAVAGDNDGVYGNGTPGGDVTLATKNDGDTVVIVTRGRCLARVLHVGVAGSLGIKAGDLLVQSTTPGVLRLLPTTGTNFVVARALQETTPGNNNDITVMMAVDVI